MQEGRLPPWMRPGGSLAQHGCAHLRGDPVTPTASRAAPHPFRLLLQRSRSALNPLGVKPPFAPSPSSPSSLARSGFMTLRCTNPKGCTAPSTAGDSRRDPGRWRVSRSLPLTGTCAVRCAVSVCCLVFRTHGELVLLSYFERRARSMWATPLVQGSNLHSQSRRLLSSRGREIRKRGTAGACAGGRCEPRGSPAI
jgi:hypothetical protein